MQRRVLLLLVALLVAAASAVPTAGAPRMLAPKVTLDRVEVAAYFPYAPPPARVPLVLAFVFTIDNPNPFTVKFEEFTFTFGFEAMPFRFFDLNTPVLYETMHIPARTANQLRVVSVLDSLIVPGLLAVAEGRRVEELGISIPTLVRHWWEKIGDFEFRVRVSNGTVRFTSEAGSSLVMFRGVFPPRK